VALVAQHPADGGVDVVVEEEPHLPGRGEQPAGLVDVGSLQVRERLKDGLSAIAML
jgi:hypothetical protein